MQPRKEKKLEVKQTRCGRWMVNIPFGLVALFVENPETRKRYHSGTFEDVSDAEMVRDAAMHEAKVKAARVGGEAAPVRYRVATSGMYAVDREPEQALLYA
jgi:hypothetical protein